MCIRDREKIAALKAEGAKQVLVYGIGRMCHIAFWEPHFAAEYPTVEAWKAAPYRIGARLHPFTIEQNAICLLYTSIQSVVIFRRSGGAAGHHGRAAALVADLLPAFEGRRDLLADVHLRLHQL